MMWTFHMYWHLAFSRDSPKSITRPPRMLCYQPSSLAKQGDNVLGSVRLSVDTLIIALCCTQQSQEL